MMNANDIPDMEESELDFCRKAFEKIYPGAAKYRLSDDNERRETTSGKRR